MLTTTTTTTTLLLLLLLLLLFPQLVVPTRFILPLLCLLWLTDQEIEHSSIFILRLDCCCCSVMFVCPSDVPHCPFFSTLSLFSCVFFLSFSFFDLLFWLTVVDLCFLGSRVACLQYVSLFYYSTRHAAPLLLIYSQRWSRRWFNPPTHRTPHCHLKVVYHSLKLRRPPPLILVSCFLRSRVITFHSSSSIQPL